MPKRQWFLSALIILSLLSIGSVSVYAQPTPTEDDTVEVSSIFSVPAETTVTVEVRLKTTRDLLALSIPLTFHNEMNLDIECDSIQWSEDWFLANPAADYSGIGGNMEYIDNDEKLVKIYSIWFAEPLPAGDDTLCTIYFTTGTFWETELVVEIDTFSVEFPSISLMIVDDPLYQSWIPVYIPGFLWASAPANGDVNCDGERTISDVVYLVNYLFKSGPPPCEPE